MKAVITKSFGILETKMPISVKLSATRCIIKYMRKLPKEQLPNAELIANSITPLLTLLE